MKIDLKRLDAGTAAEAEGDATQSAETWGLETCAHAHFQSLFYGI